MHVQMTIRADDELKSTVTTDGIDPFMILHIGCVDLCVNPADYLRVESGLRSMADHLRREVYKDMGGVN